MCNNKHTKLEYVIIMMLIMITIMIMIKIMIIIMLMIMIILKWWDQPWNYNDTNNEKIMIGISAKYK